mmetsp:Transcript_22008/g.87357  ORF Transcript_22008/g.87357 Transcript_22008/m.87357 type:complete len:229 (+) Transcript_22008:749-1435(+)
MAVPPPYMSGVTRTVSISMRVASSTMASTSMAWLKRSIMRAEQTRPPPMTGFKSWFVQKQVGAMRAGVSRYWSRIAPIGWLATATAAAAANWNPKVEYMKSVPGGAYGAGGSAAYMSSAHAGSARFCAVQLPYVDDAVSPSEMSPVVIESTCRSVTEAFAPWASQKSTNVCIGVSKDTLCAAKHATSAVTPGHLDPDARPSRVLGVIPTFEYSKTAPVASPIVIERFP